MRRLVMAGACALAIACDAPAPRAGDLPRDSAAVLDSARLIRPDGIAHARVGMTIGALRAALPGDMTLGDPAPFMVDIRAMPVIRAGDSLYYVLVMAGEPADDAAPIGMVATDDTTFRTALGVGPGMTIAAAAAIYGPATISYSTNDESREYVSFAGYQNPTVLFRATPSLEGGLAGLYATDDEYNTTTTYDPHALIGLVMVRRQP